MFTNGMCFADKQSLTSSAVFGLIPDTGLVGNQYANLGTFMCRSERSLGADKNRDGHWYRSVAASMGDPALPDRQNSFRLRHPMGSHGHADRRLQKLCPACCCPRLPWYVSLAVATLHFGAYYVNTASLIGVPHSDGILHLGQPAPPPSSPHELITQLHRAQSTWCTIRNAEIPPIPAPLFSTDVVHVIRRGATWPICLINPAPP